jgi:hypothetical protein
MPAHIALGVAVPPILTYSNSHQMSHIEELVNAGKIIRPAYKSVTKVQSYIPMNKR